MASKKKKPVKQKRDWRKDKGKHAEQFRAHDAEPTVFLARVEIMFFPHAGEPKTNREAGLKLRELLVESDMFYDFDDLTIDVKNDTDKHWDDPWPNERTGNPSQDGD